MSESKGVLCLAVTGILGLALLGVAVLSVIFGLSLGISSWHSLEYPYYGLDKDNLSGAVATNTVYEPGMHQTGINHEFLKFPKLIKFLDLVHENNITVRTYDGIEVACDVSLQYQVLRDNVVRVYSLIGDQYEDFVYRTTRNVVRNTGSRYTLGMYIQNRTFINQELFRDVRDQMMAASGITLFALELRRIYLPDTVVQAIEAIELSRRQLEAAQQARQTALYKAETDVLVAQQQQQIGIVQANAAVQIAQIKQQIDVLAAQTEANVTLARFEAKASSFKTLKDRAQFNNTEVLTLSWFDTVSQLNIKDGGKVVVNFDQSSAIVKV